LTLPSVECENCTIQLIQMMTDKPPYAVGTDDIYYNCLDVRLISTRLPGDFNADRLLTTDDIELLVEAIRTNQLAFFDLTDNGLVDVQDLVFWVADLKQTWIGDANLDGEFNSGDMVEVFQAGKYELDMHAGWGQGDWTADQRFDSGDLVAAFQDGGYESGARTAVSDVPEPSCAQGIMAMILYFIRWIRTRVPTVGQRQRRMDIRAGIAGCE
jgi:hypothetical protein